MADLKSPNFLKYYDDEKYLIGVSQTFRDSGLISPEDFLTILAWKANRATTYHLKRLQTNAGSFSEAVKGITIDIRRAEDHKARLEILMSAKWGFYLATATAILTILYPEDFTVYDYRVAGLLNFAQELRQRDFSDSLWQKYMEFRERVRSYPPPELNLSLRDCDRYMSGESYRKDIEIACKEYSAS